MTTREPGEAGPLDEALAYRILLMGMHADDAMGFSAMDQMFEGGNQRVANVVQVLAGIALNAALQNYDPADLVTEFQRSVAEKTLEADQERG